MQGHSFAVRVDEYLPTLKLSPQLLEAIRAQCSLLSRGRDGDLGRIETRSKYDNGQLVLECNKCSFGDKRADLKNVPVLAYLLQSKTGSRLKAAGELKIKKLYLRKTCEALAAALGSLHSESKSTSTTGLSPDISDFLRVALLLAADPQNERLLCKTIAILPSLGLKVTPIKHLNIRPMVRLQSLFPQAAIESQAEGKAAESGFLTFDAEHHIVPLQAADPRLHEYPLVGVWVAGLDSLARRAKSLTQSKHRQGSGDHRQEASQSRHRPSATSNAETINHVFVITAVLRFLFSREITKRMSPQREAEGESAGPCFLLVEYPGPATFPRFYEFEVRSPANPWVMLVSSRTIGPTPIPASSLPGLQFRLTTDKAAAKQLSHCSLYKLERALALLRRQDKEEDMQRRQKENEWLPQQATLQHSQTKAVPVMQVELRARPVSSCDISNRLGVQDFRLGIRGRQPGVADLPPQPHWQSQRQELPFVQQQSTSSNVNGLFEDELCNLELLDSKPAQRPHATSQMSASAAPCLPFARRGSAVPNSGSALAHDREPPLPRPSVGCSLKVLLPRQRRSCSRTGSNGTSPVLQTIMEHQRMIKELQEHISQLTAALHEGKESDRAHSVGPSLLMGKESTGKSQLNRLFTSNMENYQALNISHNFNQVSPSFLRTLDDEATTSRSLRNSVKFAPRDSDLQRCSITTVNPATLAASATTATTAPKEGLLSLTTVPHPSISVCPCPCPYPASNKGTIQGSHQTVAQDFDHMGGQKAGITAIAKSEAEVIDCPVQRATVQYSTVGASVVSKADTLSAIKETNESITSPENDPSAASKLNLPSAGFANEQACLPT